MENQNPFLQNFSSLQNKNAFVFCCGSNKFQELGFKGINQFETPQGIDSSILPEKIKQISSALNHTLILTEKGQLLGLGSNEQGNLAQDPKHKKYQSQPLPIQLDLQHPVVQIACGKFKSLCLLENGQVYQWGTFYKDEIRYTPEQIKFKDKDIIVQIGCGLNHCMALSEDGILFSWGGFVLNKNYGQCGQGHFKPVDRPQPIQFFQDKVVSDFQCGGYHSIAILQDEEVYAWGQGKYGQLGNESDKNQSLPQKINIPEDVFITQAACGRQHTLLLTNEGHVYGFGMNSKGQLGLGRTKSVFKPQKIEYLLKKYVIAIYCGSNHTILHIEPQYVYVSGQNKSGQLGLGHNRNIYKFQYQSQLMKNNIYEIFAGGDHSWFIVDYDDPFYEAEPPSSLENFTSEQETQDLQIPITNSWVEGQQRKGTMDSSNRKSISSESRINISQSNMNFQIRSVNNLKKPSLIEQLEQNDQVEFIENENSLEIEQIQNDRGQKITFGPTHNKAKQNVSYQDKIQQALKDKKITFGPSQQQHVMKIREQLAQEEQEKKNDINDKNFQESQKIIYNKQDSSYKFSQDSPQNYEDILSSQQEDNQQIEDYFSNTVQDQNSNEDSITNMEDSGDEQINQYQTQFIYKFCFTKLKYNHKILFIFFQNGKYEQIESILRKTVRKIKNLDAGFNLVQMITYKEYLNQNNRQFQFIDNLQQDDDQGLVLYFYQKSQDNATYQTIQKQKSSNYSLLNQKESSMGLLYQFDSIDIILADERWKILATSFLEIYDSLKGKVKHIVHYEYRSIKYKQNNQQLLVFFNLDVINNTYQFLK